MTTEKQNAQKYIDSKADYFRSVADSIWEKPELSLKEFSAAEVYCRALRELGFTVTESSAA